MAMLIGSERSENYGEKLFYDKASQYFDDTCIIYRNRQLYGREFDACILMPDHGVLIVEVKGWKEETVLRIENSDTIVIKTTDGEVRSNPQKQARSYRFSIQKYIQKNTGLRPLVFNMVCLPQISKAFFRSKKLNIVLEERFTFLKEDLADNAAFFHKLNLAFSDVNHWHTNDPFDMRTMIEVRKLFEVEVVVNQEQQRIIRQDRRDYSRFYFVPDEKNLELILPELVQQYSLGCKLYGVFTSSKLIRRTVEAIDNTLTKRGLARKGDNLIISFEKTTDHSPAYRDESISFSGFHMAFSVIDPEAENIMEPLCIIDGQFDREQLSVLQVLSNHSGFNIDQYMIEHASPEKNIVIRAGAGTGKTYTMISRIGYILYTQDAPVRAMADRIVMITFTNDAADQMEEKLKNYFQNLYLITNNSEYLYLISRIDQMQISTIHSYVKNLIGRLGTAFGYGVDLSLTSSDYGRRRKALELIDGYIVQKSKELGENYANKLGVPIYALRDNIVDFINKLHNKSIDMEALSATDFGQVLDGDAHRELHVMLSVIIPQIEQEYSRGLLENNQLHLSSLMSVLKRFLDHPDVGERLADLKKQDGTLQFMFVDEFQDTDDTQIEILLTLAKVLNYRLFVVGDIKQCIYRFRGAKEKAFDQLRIDSDPENWQEYSLRRNYRTDADLLDIFDKSFSAWGSGEEELFEYVPEKDRLIGTRHFNDYLRGKEDRFYRVYPVRSEEDRIKAVIKEIQRLQRRIRFEETERSMTLDAKKKSIAILVRENWQAEMIKTECAKVGITVHTNSGGDLYSSQPALDMFTLVNALLHFDEADYLYNLAISNFFNLDIQKSNLYNRREKMRTAGWRSKVDEREQVNYLVEFMNRMLSNMEGHDSKWEYIVRELRTKPVLQVIRDIYKTLEPWRHYSEDAWKQHYYQLNVDLLFEELINGCNVDRLTINTLQEQLQNSIFAQKSVDSRIPARNDVEPAIQCITVHKSKGLEYGHVILPFCSAPIDYIKPSQMQVSTERVGDNIRIGYRINLGGDDGGAVQNEYYNAQIERAEKSREETRILYVAMTRAIRSFSWIVLEGKKSLSWQKLIEAEV